MKYVLIADIISITDKTLTTNHTNEFSTSPFLSTSIYKALIGFFIICFISLVKFWINLVLKQAMSVDPLYISSIKRESMSGKARDQ